MSGAAQHKPRTQNTVVPAKRAPQYFGLRRGTYDLIAMGSLPDRLARQVGTQIAPAKPPF